MVVPHALELALSVYGVIFIAELPDKTAVATVVMATRHRPVPVFLGTALALTVQSFVAIAAGHLLSLLPPRPVHIAAGVVFLVSAILMWRRGQDDDDDETKEQGKGFWSAAWATFAVVFIAEWGDLTQLATAALAARYAAPWTVLIGATAALWSVAAIAVFVGNRAGQLLNQKTTQKVAAAVFAVIGIALVSGLL